MSTTVTIVMMKNIPVSKTKKKSDLFNIHKQDNNFNVSVKSKIYIFTSFDFQSSFLKEKKLDDFLLTI